MPKSIKDGSVEVKFDDSILEHIEVIDYDSYRNERHIGFDVSRPMLICMADHDSVVYDYTTPLLTRFITSVGLAKNAIHFYTITGSVYELSMSDDGYYVEFQESNIQKRYTYTFGSTEEPKVYSITLDIWQTKFKILLQPDISDISMQLKLEEIF